MWLDQYRTFACEYFQHEEILPAHILGYNDANDDAMEMVVMTKVALWKGAPELALAMAGCSEYIGDGPIVVGAKELSEPVFCLSSLLENGYPRDVRSNRFKGTTAGCCVGGFDGLSATQRPHVAFAGMAILIMDACSRRFSPLGNTNDVVQACRDMYLTFEECG